MQHFKVLPHAKKAAQEEAGCSCQAPWLLSMGLHHLQDLLMLWLVPQPHGRAEPPRDELAPSMHHLSPRGASPQATGCHRFAWGWWQWDVELLLDGTCCLAQANSLPLPSLSPAIIPASCRAAALAPALGLQPITHCPSLAPLMRWHHPGSPPQPRGAPSTLHECQAVST